MDKKKQSMVIFVLGAVVVILLFFCLMPYIPFSYLASTKGNCDLLYPLDDYDSALKNVECRKRVRECGTIWKEKPPVDDECETESREMKNLCYFKRPWTIRTKDIA